MVVPINAPELAPLELARALEAGEPYQVVDVRAPARAATGHIDFVPPERFHNIAGSQLITYPSLDATGIDPDLPVAVVCGHGNDSRALAHHLRRLGCDARSLRGGMAAWMQLALARQLDPPPSLDGLIQFDRIGKGALGYLLHSDGEALIVDPPRDVQAYRKAAEDAGVRVVGVADTHVHADYISGAPAITRASGVPYYLHAADAVYPYDGTPGRLEFQPLTDGEAIEFGRCSLRVAHTPGHTEGSLSYLIDDAAVLTGDFLFVASVGRPDLAGKANEWAVQLWESVERARRDWSRGRMIYPAHYSSNEERRADRTVGAPLGHVFQRNEALRFQDRESFTSWVASHTAAFPDAYRHIKAVNVGLLQVSESEAESLEVGKHECALDG